MTQSEHILNHLRVNKSITPIQALRLYGCFRLGARILELRQKGYEIKTDMVKNKFKNRFAKYIYKGSL